MNASTHPAMTRKSEMVFADAKAVGAGAADLVISSSQGQVLATGVRTGAGIFNLTFKSNWKTPNGFPTQPGIVGTTTGLTAIFTAWAPATGTATVKFSVGSVATDPAATDTIYFGFWLRNSGRNS